MPCYKPLDAWRPRESTGSKKLVFSYNPQTCESTTPLQVPCGQCVGCRLERSRQWAIRCVHESKLHKDNCFITLTYNDANLPSDKSLHYRDFQLFMKKLRKQYPDKKIRFYMCGEYGENFGRPHFHACLFNFNFDDLTLWKTQNKQKLYRSKKLEKLWPLGHSSVGTVTFESAAYVARYIMKKVTGDAAEDHYTFCRSFNRGNLTPPRGIHPYVAQARHSKRLVRDVSLGRLSTRPNCTTGQTYEAPKIL